MKTFTSHSLEETRAVAADWLKMLADTQTDLDEAALVGLSGHLGAGKTAFVKQVAKELGVEEEVTSPTFVIMKMYEITHPQWHRLVHIDAYRLEKRGELQALDWEKLIADPYNLIMVEWPENVGLEDFRESAYLKFEIKEGAYTVIMH